MVKETAYTTHQKEENLHSEMLGTQKGQLEPVKLNITKEINIYNELPQNSP